MTVFSPGDRVRVRDATNLSIYGTVKVCCTRFCLIHIDGTPDVSKGWQTIQHGRLEKMEDGKHD